MDDVKIDWCPIERIPDLQRLIDQHWRPGHILSRDAELLRWQYRHLASDRHLAIMIAMDSASGDLLGCLGFIQTPFDDRGTQRLALWMSMWLLVPEARGKGLGFALLDRVIKDGHEVIACVGFNDITKRLVSGLGFHIQDAMPRWVRPVSLPALLAVTEARPEAYPQAIRDRWVAASVAVSERPSELVRPWRTDDAALWDEAWASRLAGPLVATWHDAEYLAWRYLRHPSFTYRVHVTEGPDGSLRGLSVYRLEQIQGRAERVLRLVELLGSGTALDALVAHALRTAREEGVAFVDFHCTAAGLLDVLEKHGFYRDDQEPPAHRLPLFFQPLDFRTKPLNFTLWVNGQVAPDVERFATENRLYFTRADGDQDRPN